MYDHKKELKEGIKDNRIYYPYVYSAYYSAVVCVIG
jgi:hypothetical protein